MIKWHIGCSGFSYAAWKEVFYPTGLQQSKWFEYYSSKFNTLELNVTFYRFPQSSFLQSWYNKSPAEFSFSLKAPRHITHFNRFNNTQQMLADFYGTAREGLQEKLGCILFQLPASHHYSEEYLDTILSSLDPTFQNVLEFRHISWWNDEVYKRLAKHKITFSGVSINNLPDNAVCKTKTIYYRFHGVPVLYKSQYEKSKLAEIADQVNQCKKVKDAYLYFNNTWGIAGINNAREMDEHTRALK